MTLSSIFSLKFSLCIKQVFIRYSTTSLISHGSMLSISLFKKTFLVSKIYLSTPSFSQSVSFKSTAKILLKSKKQYLSRILSIFCLSIWSNLSLASFSKSSINICLKKGLKLRAKTYVNRAHQSDWKTL